ncbi:MAG: GNAT family N-acetyltransferase [Chloroflexia bacterium]|nr:GNAT family N-acetyltransferase [Chloroflexia bacterium]
MLAETLGEVLIRPLRESDLTEADRIERLAFGTYLGLPDPMAFLGDAADIATRWQTEPEGAFAAELDGALIGTNFATRWGSVGILGPLTIHPDYWNRGYATPLIKAVVDCLVSWGTTHDQLFTFAQSPKHHALYQKAGFWPRFLTPLMSTSALTLSDGAVYERFSGMSGADQEHSVAACRKLTQDIQAGLDLTVEIQAVRDLNLGDTILLHDADGLQGFAVCHCGPGTEAGSGVCSVKFGAVRPGPDAAEAFSRLVSACETFTIKMGMQSLTTSVNTSRIAAYQMLLKRGYRSTFIGISMHRPNEPGYCRPDVFVIEGIA